MSEIKKFVTSAKNHKRETLTFEVDGREITAREPDETLIIQVQLSEESSSRTSGQKMATYVDFCLALFDDDTKAYFTARLFDLNDDFDHETLTDIAMWVIEEFTNRPTKPSSDSTTSLEDGGTSSTVTASDEESVSSISDLVTPAT